jgi:hypothetical protein
MKRPRKVHIAGHILESLRKLGIEERSFVEEVRLLSRLKFGRIFDIPHLVGTRLLVPCRDTVVQLKAAIVIVELDSEQDLLHPMSLASGQKALFPSMISAQIQELAADVDVIRELLYVEATKEVP